MQTLAGLHNTAQHYPLTLRRSASGGINAAMSGARGMSSASITSLLNAGKRLTAAEFGFLRKNDTALYAKALKVAEDRCGYGMILKQCRTRDEARSMHMQKLGKLSKKIDYGADVEEALMSVSAAARAYNDYTATREYAKLPENALALARKLHKNKAGIDMFDLKRTGGS